MAEKPPKKPVDPRPDRQQPTPPPLDTVDPRLIDWMEKADKGPKPRRKPPKKS